MSTVVKLSGRIKELRLAGRINMIPSEGGGGPLQAKTVYPSHSEQVVAPDEDYYGLVAVTVKAVPRVRAMEPLTVTSEGPIEIETALLEFASLTVMAEDYTA